MKASILTLVMTVSLVSNISFAEESSTSAYPQKSSQSLKINPRPSSFLVDGFNFGFEHLNLASYEIDVKNKLTGTVQKNLKEDASKHPDHVGFKVGYKRIQKAGVGADLSLSVLKAERRREGASDLTSFLSSASFIAAAPDYVYGALGLNTLVVVGDEYTTHSPRIGYQIGGGVVVLKNLNFEVFYNWINQGLESKYALIEERTTSTTARLIYAF